MNEKGLKLLGDLVAPLEDVRDLPARSDAAIALVVEDAGLSSDVEAAINGFLEEPSEPRLRLVQVAVVRSGLWLIGARRFVDLASRLATDRHLTLAEAARALAGVPLAERKRLDRDQQEVLRIADVVLEDAQEGFIEIEDDELLLTALRRTASRSP
jgi:hypothetical protein